jgi:hypothetical protein
LAARIKGDDFLPAEFETEEDKGTKVRDAAPEGVFSILGIRAA